MYSQTQRRRLCNSFWTALPSQRSSSVPSNTENRFTRIYSIWAGLGVSHFTENEWRGSVNGTSTSLLLPGVRSLGWPNKKYPLHQERNVLTTRSTNFIVIPWLVNHNCGCSWVINNKESHLWRSLLWWNALHIYYLALQYSVFLLGSPTLWRMD